LAWPTLDGPGVFGAAVLDRLAWVLVAALPWSVWLVIGVCQPFSTSSSARRGQMLLGWGWFVATGLAVLVAGVGLRGRSAWPLLPVGALLVAQVLRQFIELSAEGRHARLWRVGRWAQFAGVAVVSVVLPTGLWLQPRMVAWGWLARPLTGPVHWAFAAGLGVALVAIALISLRMVLRHYPGRAVVAWAVWTVVAATLTLVVATEGAALQPALAETPPLAATLAGR
jgi:hypothetical protein